MTQKAIVKPKPEIVQAIIIYLEESPRSFTQIKNHLSKLGLIKLGDSQTLTRYLKRLEDDGFIHKENRTYVADETVRTTIQECRYLLEKYSQKDLVTEIPSRTSSGRYRGVTMPINADSLSKEESSAIDLITVSAATLLSGLHDLQRSIMARRAGLRDFPYRNSTIRALLHSQVIRYFEEESHLPIEELALRYPKIDKGTALTKSLNHWLQLPRDDLKPLFPSRVETYHLEGKNVDRKGFKEYFRREFNLDLDQFTVKEIQDHLAKSVSARPLNAELVAYLGIAVELKLREWFESKGIGPNQFAAIFVSSFETGFSRLLKGYTLWMNVAERNLPLDIKLVLIADTAWHLLEQDTKMLKSRLAHPVDLIEMGINVKTFRAVVSIHEEFQERWIQLKTKPEEPDIISAYPLLIKSCKNRRVPTEIMCLAEHLFGEAATCEEEEDFGRANQLEKIIELFSEK